MGNFNRGGGFGRNRDRGGRPSFGGGRPNFRRDDRREVTMTKVICDGCGKSCEVPFKPTAGKPVFCNECFRGQSNGNQDRGPKREFNNKPNNEVGIDLKKQLETLNFKLDKILSFVGNINDTDNNSNKESVEVVSTPKKENKKVSKKKAGKK